MFDVEFTVSWEQNFRPSGKVSMTHEIRLNSCLPHVNDVTNLCSKTLEQPCKNHHRKKNRQDLVNS